MRKHNYFTIKSPHSRETDSSARSTGNVPENGRVSRSESRPEIHRPQLENAEGSHDPSIVSGVKTTDDILTRIKDAKAGEFVYCDDGNRYVSYLDGIKEMLTAIEQDIFPIYKGLISKPDSWRMQGDEICDFIEDRIKEKLARYKEALT